MRSAPDDRVCETGTGGGAARVTLLSLCALTFFGCGGVDTGDYAHRKSERATAGTDAAQNGAYEGNADAPTDGTTPQPNVPNNAIEVVQAQKPSPQSAAQADAPVLEKIVDRVPRVMIAARRFKVEGPEEAIRVTYEDLDLLRVLNMEPVTDEAVTLMPDWLKALKGRRIRLRGYMFPPYNETGLTTFGFTRDNNILSFGRSPKVYEAFNVILRKGVTTDYIQARPFDVVGVFHFRPFEDWDTHGMCRIDDAIVVDR